MVGVTLHAQKASGADHFGCLQSGSAEFPHNLPKGVVGKTRHRGLQ